jgi:Domain of unknown function (DUF4440)
MNRIFLSLIVIVFVFTSCVKKQVLTEKEVLNVINKFDSGWRNKNLQQVDAVLAPGYVYFTQSGGVFSREGVVQTAGSQAYMLDRMDRSDFMVDLYDNTAIVSTRWRGRGIYNEQPFDEDQRCSITVIKVKGKVQIFSEHCTPIKSSTNISLMQDHSYQY